MKILVLLAVFAAAVPCRAQSIEDMFGVYPGDIIAEAKRQQAEYEAKLAVERARKAKGDWLGELMGSVVAPSQDQGCMLDAVAKHLGAAKPAGSPPPVYRASRTLIEDYRDYYYAEVGTAETPNAVATTYFPTNNVIFVEDRAKAYAANRAIDDALAGQFALYVQYKTSGRHPRSPEAKAAAAETETWFHTAYTARKASACR